MKIRGCFKALASSTVTSLGISGAVIGIVGTCTGVLPYAGVSVFISSIAGLLLNFSTAQLLEAAQGIVDRCEESRLLSNTALQPAIRTIVDSAINFEQREGIQQPLNINPHLFAGFVSQLGKMDSSSQFDTTTLENIRNITLQYNASLQRAPDLRDTLLNELSREVADSVARNAVKKAFLENERLACTSRTLTQLAFEF